MGEPSMINTGVLQRNPFPGSRPFFSAEDQFFFGRDEAVSEVLKILLKKRFVALVGASASGKTSLIQSGIIPALLSDMKEEWVPVFIRPGKRPIESLIRGFQKVFSKKISESDVHTFLRNSNSLGDFLIEKGLGNYNYFLVVDQFEELFTWPVVVKKRKSGRNPDAVPFINHLMNLVEEEEPMIYLMLSIRSDFLDYCSTFRSLTEHLNQSKYLLPQMSQEDLKEAILEPLRVSGASVESGFEDYLLKELKDVEPQLPLLQNALKKTWDHWKKQGKADQPISLDDYRIAGSIRGGLSRDLEQIYQSMEFYQKEICERIFKTIAFKTGRQEAYSRRTTLGSIARIAKCSIDRVLEVVEIFDKAGQPFLSNKLSENMTSETKIELPHESLIHVWDRLLQWVDEEDESIRMYLKISRASASYQQDKGALLVADELQQAIDWKREQNPTPAWGIQFDPAYERAMVFLNTSEEEYLWSEKRKIILKRRKKILNRSLVIGGVVIVSAVALIIYISRNRSLETDRQVQLVQENSVSQRSEPSRGVDRRRRNEEAVVQSQDAREGQQSRENEQPAEEASPLARENQPAANRTEENQAEENQAEDDMQADENQTEDMQVEVNQVTENSRENIREENDTEETSSGSVQSTIEQAEQVSVRSREKDIVVTIAQDVAYQSVGIVQNTDLQGLLAYQAYLLNKRNGGDSYDSDIYKGLYESLKKLVSPAYYIYPNIRNTVKAIKWLDRSGSILTASSDGSIKVLSGNIANRASQITLAGTGLNNECLGVSPDERVAAVGTNGGGMVFIELENRGEVIHQNTAQGDVVLFIENLGRSGTFLSAGTDNSIRKWNYSNFSASTFLTLRSRPLAITASANGSRVAIGTGTGRIYTLNARDTSSLEVVNSFGSNQVRALDFSPAQRYLAVGMLDGSVKILSGDGRRAIANLFGPGARVSALEFSPDGRLLVAASNDGNVYLWRTEKWDEPPVVFTENNGFVLSLCFNGNSSYFYSGSVAFPRMVGRPSNPDRMAEQFCSLLGRNLTREEWNQYFGIDIPYEETCPR